MEVRTPAAPAGSTGHSIPSHCEIRDLAIEDPFWTYCGNHPYRLQRRVPVPLGPVYVHVGESFERDGETFYGDGLLGVVVDELERLREPRAIPILERVAEEVRGHEEATRKASRTLARIGRAVRAPRGE